jgi:deazaflavin-dependent oxidoreductase (nitroreductase family)
MTAPTSESRLARVGGRILRTRWLVRAPIWVYQARFGVMFGGRMLMLEHIGRTSGARRHVVLEVFGHPDPDTYLIVSGFGERAQWYRNLLAEPRARLWARSARPRPVVAERLPDAEADAALDRYVERHAAAWERLKVVVEHTLGHPINRGRDIPIMALRVVRPEA